MFKYKQTKNNIFNPYNMVTEKKWGLVSTICILLLIVAVELHSQEIIWNSGVNTFFDNREYFNNYVQPQSMLGVHGFLSAGVQVDAQNKFLGGFNYMYEFGSEADIENISPTLYFEHISKHTQVNMGAFPRKDLFKLPNVLQHDTFAYYRPQVEGIYLKFSIPSAYQKVYLDWTSRQTNTDRETFLIGGTGQVTPGNLFIRYDFIMYHYAGTAIPDENDHIRDNGGLDLIAGYNLSQKTTLDSLVLSTGVTMSYDRLRNVYDTDFRTGSLSEIYANYRGLGLRSTTYFGEGQTQMVGDGLYSAKFYSRLDFELQLFRKSPVKSYVEFSLHFLPEVVDMSQKFVIYLKFGGKSKTLKKEQIL